MENKRQIFHLEDVLFIGCRSLLFVAVNDEFRLFESHDWLTAEVAEDGIKLVRLSRLIIGL